MPYIQRVSIFPDYGKVTEAHAVLEARGRALQEAGYRTALFQTVYGLDPPAYYGIIVFEDLPAVGQFLATQAQGSAELRANLAPLVRKPMVSAVAEVIVPNPRPGPAAYSLWITQRPRPEKAAEYGALAAEWALARGSQGYRMAFIRQRVGPDDVATFVTSVAFDDLIQVQELWSRGAEDATVKFLNDALPMLSTAWTSELLRVVVPIQPPR